ncbi:MAG: bis-aminopropyl spermidine synthase family protein [Thermoanaerobaculia bacterium]|nr:bis-aminopropyl spermidine synthase family protein [Thermoanaerobaculia bacterium]
MIPKVSPPWTTSMIAHEAWTRGSLFPPARERIQWAAPHCCLGCLQRRTQLPGRLALFMAWNMQLSFSYRCAGPSQKDDLSSVSRSAARSYFAARHVRGRPALLFGQRFITPRSALARAEAISRNTGSSRSVIFLGDDDLVSPILSFLRPDLRVTVLDIDANVLNALKASRRPSLEIVACDLRNGIPAVLRGRFDLFVADPFPSSDGSFELMFVAAGTQALSRSGARLGLVSLAPTHKTNAFGQRQVQLVQTSGARLLLWDTATAEYELIPGEWSPLEETTLATLDPRQSSFSHAKTLALFRWDEPSLDPPRGTPIDAWVECILAHDLTWRLGGTSRLQEEAKRTAVGYSLPSFLNEHISDERQQPGLSPLSLLEDLQQTSSHRESARQQVPRIGPAAEGGRLTDPWEKELPILQRATALGPVTPFSSASPSFELYLVARLYESYFRGTSPLPEGLFDD